MKILRFMSKLEFEKYKNGIKLQNDKKHEGNTNSIGFCFLNIEDYTPEEAMHFLSGIVTFDICAVFETNVELNKTYGAYAKPIKGTGNYMEDLLNLFSRFTDRFTVNEYCVKQYDKQNFKLLKYSENIYEQWQPGEEQKNLIWRN